MVMVCGILRLRADLMRICKHHIGFFGGSIPFDSYLFLTLATSKDYGGLEHCATDCLKRPRPLCILLMVGANSVRYCSIESIPVDSRHQTPNKKIKISNHFFAFNSISIFLTLRKRVILVKCKPL
jgi:hypothetical protein